MDESTPDAQHSARNEKIEPRTRSRRSLSMMIIGLMVGVFGTLVGLAIIAGPVALAHRSNFPLERAYGSFAVTLASRFHSGNQATPVVQDSRAIESGRSAYTGSCSICHGLDGTGKGIFGKATYPNATDLTSENAIEMSDSQLYWIIANGLSFTGMPGFNSQYKSQDIWSVVSYIRTLQKQGPSAGAIDVPTATTAQLAAANPAGTAAERGAAVYFALGCQTCHGAVGNAPGQLALRRGGEEATRTIRDGRNGMPGYGTDVVSDAQLSDLQAYLATFNGRRESGNQGGPGSEPSTAGIQSNP